MKRKPDSWSSPAPATPVRDRVGTVGDLHASATRLTGLNEFGEDDYLDGLAMLLDSYQRNEKLTPLGQKMHRVALRSALAARLVSEAAWKQHPEHASVTIDQPIFVLGLPRTGTTALHRLLTADPANQGLELWLTQMPQPRPPRETWASDPFYTAMDEGFKQHHIEHPEFMGLHLLGADQVEECWRLLWQSMRSISFECLAHLPTYSSWLRSKDWTDAYRRHRRNLQLIGLNDPKRRWVLKNPSHLFALDELLAVYPDALIIQTHRLPRVVIGSACSLSAHATAGWSEKFLGPVIGADQLELWGRGLDEFVVARARYDQARFCDVWYDEFVSDPLGTVESVYEYFDIELTGPAADGMRAMQAESTGEGPGGVTGGPRDARWRHKYSLADFGLTAEQVDERFAGYLGTRI
ncbi:MAG TPA: sulfotransferase [Streptosporangiaceae bacterium]|nr:sulfotransferase [Streptosporangiaceae bacterium]